MSIHIRKITAKNLGPIPELNWEPKEINIIFGNNEKGKSYLVEFLIRSMFKSAEWDLREHSGSGRVTLTGLTNKELEFSPDSRRKIEDFLEKEHIGLPPNFSKLLVTRGVNPLLGKGGEPDKIMLRNYLSQKGILDKIEENIEQETIKTCQISGYQITGDERGKLKERKELNQRLKSLNSLLEKIQTEYWSGELQTLNQQLEKYRKQYNQLEKAKQFYAFQLAKEIEKLKTSAKEIKEEEIDNVLEEIAQLSEAKRRLQQGKKEITQLKEDAQQYAWLKNAVEEYQKYNFEDVTKEKISWLPFLSLAAVILAGAMILANLKTPGFISLIISGILNYVYFSRQRKINQEDKKIKELKALEKKFAKEFDKKISTLADLTTEKDRLEDSYNRKKILENQIKEEEKGINLKTAKIADKIEELTGKKGTAENWRKLLNEEKKRKRELEREANRLENKLSRLDVENYLETEPDAEFSWSGYEQTKSRLDKVTKKVEQKKQNLQSLKQRICDQTGDNIETEWNQLIDNFLTEKEETLQQYKQLTAKIMAKKYVHDVVTKLYQEEDKNIHQTLQSEILQETLPQVTTHYNDIELQGENLIVKDNYNSYPVLEISDGAKEQVFLSLRLALAKKWLENEEMFLILDDAFIHSDQERTKELVNKFLELAEQGWQIFCFTFDERIKDLFDKKNKNCNTLNLN
ncbi:MAG: ATP-binding protein [Patescibacteria group bacterium]